MNNPYQRQNIFTLSSGAFPFFSDDEGSLVRLQYTRRINEGDKATIDIFRSKTFENIEKAVLFGNHIFYHYGTLSKIPFTGNPKEFLEGFFQSHQVDARLRLQTMMRRAGNIVVNNAATYFKSFYTAAPEEAVAGAEPGGPAYEKLKEARTPGTAAKTADIYSKYAGGTFYEATKEAANKYAYHHGIFGIEKKIMMTEFMLIDEQYRARGPEVQNKMKAKAILNYYRGQVSTTFNPIIKKMRNIALKNRKDEGLQGPASASEIYGVLYDIRRGADGYPALLQLGHSQLEKGASTARGRAASSFILHMLGNILTHGNLFHVLPIDEKNLLVKAVIGRFALMTGAQFPEFDVSQLKIAEVISGLFGTAARDNNTGAALTENLDRGHRHGMYLMGKTEGDFRRNEIFNVTKDNIFTNSKRYRASINLVAADKDFTKALVKMLESLKKAGSPKRMPPSIFKGGLTPPTREAVEVERKDGTKMYQFYWAVPYLGIYDVEYSQLGGV